MLLGIRPLETWKKNFRLSQDEVNTLVQEISPYIVPNLLSPNHKALTHEKKVASTLYYLKDTGSQIMTATTFGVEQNTVSCVIYCCNYGLERETIENSAFLDFYLY